MTQINHSTVPAIPGEFDNPNLRERLRQIPALPNLGLFFRSHGCYKFGFSSS